MSHGCSVRFGHIDTYLCFTFVPEQIVPLLVSQHALFWPSSRCVRMKAEGSTAARCVQRYSRQLSVVLVFRLISVPIRWTCSLEFVNPRRGRRRKRPTGLLSALRLGLVHCGVSPTSSSQTESANPSCDRVAPEHKRTTQQNPAEPGTRPAEQQRPLQVRWFVTIRRQERRKNKVLCTGLFFRFILESL